MIRSASPRTRFALILCVSAGAALGGPAATRASDDVTPTPVPSEHHAPDSLGPMRDSTATPPAPERPYLAITYADSATSINTRCIVSELHLSRSIPPVWVNGEAVGFC